MGRPDLLALESVGTGGSVLLLHGLVSSSRYFDRVTALLRHDHRVLRADLLGFGRSPRPEIEYSADEQVDALVRTLDEAGVDHPIVVAGHSAGSIVGLRFAQRAPERVSALLLFGAPLYPDPDAARTHLAAMGPMARLFALPGPLAGRVCEWVCNHRELAARLAVLGHPSFPAAVAADSVAHTWRSYSLTLENVVLRAPAAAWLSSLEPPVELIVGDRDPVIDLSYTRQLAVRQGSPELHVWEGDHHLPIRRPADVAERIRITVRQMS